MQTQDDATLEEELAKHIGEIVFIGARSSFFFIGPAEEALSSLDFIALMMHRIACISRGLRVMHDSKPSRRRKKPKLDGQTLGKRKVLKVYPHDIYDGSTIIIIEGKEFGMFWSRDEYLVQKEALQKEAQEF